MTTTIDLDDATGLLLLDVVDMRDRAYRLSKRLIVDQNRIGPGYLILACAGYWSGRLAEIAGDVPDGQVLLGVDLAAGDDFGARLWP